jgi:hypothetical protein
MERIPSDTHPWQAKDNLLDPIGPEALFVLFQYAFRGLAEEGVLERFKTAEGRSLSLASQG